MSARGWLAAWRVELVKVLHENPKAKFLGKKFGSVKGPIMCPEELLKGW